MHKQTRIHNATRPIVSNNNHDSFRLLLVIYSEARWKKRRGFKGFGPGKGGTSQDQPRAPPLKQIRIFLTAPTTALSSVVVSRAVSIHTLNLLGLGLAGGL